MGKGAILARHAVHAMPSGSPSWARPLAYTATGPAAPRVESWALRQPASSSRRVCAVPRSERRLGHPLAANPMLHPLAPWASHPVPLQVEFNKAALSLADAFPADQKKAALNRLLKVGPWGLRAVLPESRPRGNLGSSGATRAASLRSWTPPLPADANPLPVAAASTPAGQRGADCGAGGAGAALC